MGCDIHCYAEKKVDGQWVRVERAEPFESRQYGKFAFLAGVRNYSEVTPIAEPRGFPSDASEHVRRDYESWSGDAHTPSWLMLEELLAFGYDQQMEDRRVTRQVGPNAWDGGQTAAPGGGRITTYREFLGEEFIDELNELKADGVERLVFWFDN